MNYIKTQILRDEMYSDLVQDYDTSNMSEQELSDTHNKIITIVGNTLVYGSVSLIITCSVMILYTVFTNGSPTSFGIYG